MPLRDFHPAVRGWFENNFAAASEPQRLGWPKIQAGENCLIAAPTGSGKTLAAFLTAIDSLVRQGEELPDETQVLYISPLKALGNDIQKNLEAPLAEIRERSSDLPQIRVLVRTGDSTQLERVRMKRKPPHILVTTPESLYILLTSDGGRGMLKSVRTVIVDEIHAVLGNKRGSHLSLSLERLEALTGPLQRIGLSATQNPIQNVSRFLVGKGRTCTIVDAGHLREIDVDIELPQAPLTHVCSHETWGEIYERITQLIREHKTTLIFVNTRKMSERIAARLSESLGEDEVMSHHGSLSKEIRLDAEHKLKAGKLKALVATASLELGIDIGDIDLVIQIGTVHSIATFLQRIGRSGHSLTEIPKGRIFPLTLDELVAAVALLSAVKNGKLDRMREPGRPLDILAQQIVAACVAEPWSEDELFACFTKAWPYRELSRKDFEDILVLHSKGRYCLLHRDSVNKSVRATKRARLTAICSGGAIPDAGDYRVILEPDETFIGTVNEDFAIESNRGDIFQLGNSSWRILKIETGKVRVADAKGQPPTLPFWFGEAPARTEELSQEICQVRESALDPMQPLAELELPEQVLQQLTEYMRQTKAALGVIPTQDCMVIERFFDESGGMQLVIHAPFGGRINRAFGLAIRKRFCRGFGFELQAAANEDAIVLSLGPQHSFPLDDIFDFLHVNTVRQILTQALLPQPMFTNRWRWNASRSLLLERMRNGKRVPIALQRMRAEDLLALSFPQVLACPETLTNPDIEIPMEHPLVRQTIEDCLTEAMDIDGLLALLRRLSDGSIRRVAVDTAEPSPIARGILSAQPYAFLDNAPLEERRTQAVLTRRSLDVKQADEIGALDSDAVLRVRDEAWPCPQSAEELHEALCWMGYVTVKEAEPWEDWTQELEAAKRIVSDDGRWFAVEMNRDPREIWRGRLQALGPVVSDDPTLNLLEAEGFVLRTRLAGKMHWCERRLLARIHRYTVERLRREIVPATAQQYLRFLACWQHVDPDYKLHGPEGLLAAIEQLQGFEAPAIAWEMHILAARIRGYRRDWLDELSLSGEIAWGRLWGGSGTQLRTTPITLTPREHLETWCAMAGPPELVGLSACGLEVLETLHARGALFLKELRRRTNLLPVQLEQGIAELIARGALTCDSFGGLRRLLVAASRRKGKMNVPGRWSLFRSENDSEEASDKPSLPSAEFIADRLLDRYGIVFRRVLARERHPVPWRDLLRIYRLRELRGDLRGGRFVAGFDGEQYARPEAVRLLRKLRKQKDLEPIQVSAADPLNLRGILTPDERIAPSIRKRVEVG